MTPERQLARWEATGSVTDATYEDAATLLLHAGFAHLRKTGHTHYWQHPLLDESSPCPTGIFSLTEPHGKGKKPNLYSSDVRKVVEVIRWVERQQKESLQTPDAQNDNS